MHSHYSSCVDVDMKFDKRELTELECFLYGAALTVIAIAIAGAFVMVLT